MPKIESSLECPNCSVVIPFTMDTGQIEKPKTATEKQIEALQAQVKELSEMVDASQVPPEPTAPAAPAAAEPTPVVPEPAVPDAQPAVEAPEPPTAAAGDLEVSVFDE